MERHIVGPGWICRFGSYRGTGMRGAASLPFVMHAPMLRHYVPQADRAGFDRKGQPIGRRTA